MLIILIPVLTVSSLKAQDLYWGGFVEGLWGAGMDKANPTDRDFPVSEMRTQLRLESYGDNTEMFAKLDFIQDGFDSLRYDWELREAYLKFRIPAGIDFKIGRQILTWGTGDLIFINDVFAKDYQSFFIGRQDQYLKAPQTAIRAEWYTGVGSFSLVLIPDFEPNILPTGDRLSFFNPQAGNIVGMSGYMPATEPANKFRNGEIAFRYAKSVDGFELAGYAYRGFYKDPKGADPVIGLYYPSLRVYGASLRGQTAGGVLWLEGGYYDSRDDLAGDNFMIENSSIKGLIGFERQVATDLTGNLQFQAEMMSEYDEYEQSHSAFTNAMPPESPAYPKADEIRTLITSRWRKQLASQTITISLFGFYSPSDEDGYARFSTEYKFSDELGLMIGGNIFEGREPNTLFGQFNRNDNLYFKVNYGF
jgi:hypothetical protein